MTVRIGTTPEADEDIRRTDLWWRENREASPDLSREELSDTVALIARSPEIGRRYKSEHVRGVRRMLLRATRYRLYYVARGDLVTVLTVWSAVRGRGPRL